MGSRPASASVARLGAWCAVAAAVAWGAQFNSPHRRIEDGQAAAPAAVPSRCVDLNAAGAEELALLPGIGPSIAARIVRDRDARGPFASVDDLRRVKGIGTATLDRVRPFATAGQAT